MGADMVLKEKINMDDFEFAAGKILSNITVVHPQLGKSMVSKETNLNTWAKNYGKELTLAQRNKLVRNINQFLKNQIKRAVLLAKIPQKISQVKLGKILLKVKKLIARLPKEHEAKLKLNYFPSVKKAYKEFIRASNTYHIAKMLRTIAPRNSYLKAKEALAYLKSSERFLKRVRSYPEKEERKARVARVRIARVARKTPKTKPGEVSGGNLEF